MFRSILLSTFLVTSVLAQGEGPGDGRWDVVTPESQGLVTEYLDQAEAYINENVGERSCYLVVKNGKIVYEKYRLGRDVTTTTELYSHTKSLCSQMFGVASQQGWADVFGKVGVTDPNYGTRQCNPDATFQNVLTMTGQSKDLRRPVFDYDANGQNCLDSLQDTVSENNPEGMWATAWKDKHWAGPLGLEHMQWGRSQYLNCGYSARSSCRDAARVAQLWNNNGRWPGHGQLISEEFARRARTWVFPDSYAWAPYGYTLWLWVNDDVDSEVGMMGGANAQCTMFAPEQNAVVVSFGMDEGDDCDLVWEASKYAIYTDNNNEGKGSATDQNKTFSFTQKFNKAVTANGNKHGNGTSTNHTNSQSKSKSKAAFRKFSEQDILNIREFAMTNADKFDERELKMINKRLLKLGAEPIL